MIFTKTLSFVASREMYYHTTELLNILFIAVSRTAYAIDTKVAQKDLNLLQKMNTVVFVELVCTILWNH